ncbi:hypothetical protein FQR65_LT20935 [Abscondita terminalis]|nr:hypothetical protein FQR65_LT20935 [Abscondita terminalis]
MHGQCRCPAGFAAERELYDTAIAGLYGWGGSIVTSAKNDRACSPFRREYPQENGQEVELDATDMYKGGLAVSRTSRCAMSPEAKQWDLASFSSGVGQDRELLLHLEGCSWDSRDSFGSQHVKRDDELLCQTQSDKLVSATRLIAPVYWSIPLRQDGRVSRGQRPGSFECESGKGLPRSANQHMNQLINRHLGGQGDLSRLRILVECLTLHPSTRYKRRGEADKQLPWFRSQCRYRAFDFCRSCLYWSGI